MYKYFSLLLLASLTQISSVKAEITRDSIGVENLKGKKLIIHRIVAHDTYYSVARRYNVSPKEIMSYNDSKYLQVGVIIKVPTSVDFNSTQSAKPGVQSTASEQGSPNSQETEYTTKPKDNLNRIAEKYGTTIADLKRMNNLNSSNLHIGQVLKVPVKAGEGAAAESQIPAVDTTPVKVKAVESTRRPDQGVTKTINVPAPNKNVPSTSTNAPTAKTSVPAANTDADPYEELVEHTVASNETIYSIATTYHLTMDQLKAKNNLNTNSLHVGQKLLIKGQYGRVPKATSSSEPLASGDTTIKDPSLRGAPSRYGLNQVDEKGTGTWIVDPDLDPSKMLVLHRSAPVGTIIKVTNPMTNRSTFAKVVGKFTENETTKDVIIVMTKAVADSIGALDKRFFCNLTYSGQEIEQ